MKCYMTGQENVTI